LSVLTRSFVQERHPFLSVGVLSLHDLSGAMFTEAELWKFVAEQPGTGGSPDTGMVKSRAEFLLSGSAYPPGGIPTTTCEVSVQLGELEKRLTITGDRVWEDDQPSPPVPFTEMALTWQHAFGGEDFANNPLGKGIKPVPADPPSVQPLPNVERADAPVRSPEDLPAPASFGPLDFAWPQRQSKAGTYDDAWLEEQFPGHALDMDWTIFNCTPDDQQLPGGGFVGDESFTLTGVHPSKPQLTGSLPRLAARCLVDCESDGPPVFQELPLALTTVWFFPEAERYLLVFHGALPVQEDDAADVRHLMIAGEDLGTQKPMTHYEEVFALRTHPEHGPLHGLDDAPLLPASPSLLAGIDTAAAADKELLERENFTQTYQRARSERERTAARAQLEAEGLDPDLYCPIPDPIPDPPADIGEAIAQAQAQKEAAELQAAEAKAKAATERAQTEAELEAAGLDPEAVLSAEDSKPAGPPAFTAAAAAAELTAALSDAAAQGMDIPQLRAMLDDPAQQQQWRKAEETARESYRRVAQEQGPAPRLEGAIAAEARASFDAGAAAGAPLVRLNLTGVDLSGLDLAGRDLSECWLESADLTGTNLEGATLDRAVLTRADLTGANLRGAKLRGANLSLALCKDTALDSTDLTEAVLVKTRFDGASLREAMLAGATVMELDSPTADLSGANLEGVTLRQMDLRGLTLADAKLDGSQLLEVDLSGVDLSGASLGGVAVVESTVDGANFDHSSICGSCFVMDSSAAAASFVGAVVETTNFRGLNLRAADFSNAKLKGSDFSECDLSDAKLKRISAPGALFVRTNLVGADLQTADLMGAILQKSDLSGADLSGANLYAADLSLIQSGPTTQLEGANEEKARRVPELQPMPPVPSHLPWLS